MENQRPTNDSFQNAAIFFSVGALGGGLAGLFEAPFRWHLTRGGISSGFVEAIVKVLLFAGFYACLYGALGLIAGLVFGRFSSWYEKRSSWVLAASLLVVEIIVLYCSVSINRRLPPLGHPLSLVVNAVLLIGAVGFALTFFFLFGKALSKRVSILAAIRLRDAVVVSVALCLAGVVACAFFVLTPVTIATIEKKPVKGSNIVFITVDTLRADHLPCYGYPHIRTPAVDSIAASGIVFEKAFSTTSWTLPAFATLMTGRTPRASHVQEVGDTLSKDTATLAEVFRKSGRTTIGISSNPFLSAPYGFDRGFDRFVNVFDRDARAGLAGIYFFDHTYRLKKSLEDAQNVNRCAFRQISDLSDAPFFLWVHYMDPHKPYGGPWPLELPDYDKGYKGSISFVYGWAKPVNERRDPLSEADLRHVRALYDADIVRFDRFFEKLLARMKSSGLLKNTIFIIASDHGEEFLEHGDFEHGKNLYATQTHVPLIIAGHGIPKGVRRKERVSILDVPKTICKLAGVDAPDSFDGKELFPVQENVPERVVLGELKSNGRHRLSLRGEFSELTDGALLLDIKTGDARLYNSAIDHGETKDLSGQFPERVEFSTEQLQKRFREESVKASKIKKGQPVQLFRDDLEILKNLGYIVQ